MIVGPPVITGGAEEVRLEAPVEVESGDGTGPGILWFALPRAYERFLAPRADALAVALLPLAMHLGEELHVDGELSPRLAHGMREYQRMQALWKPDLFREVAVHCTGLSSPSIGESVGGVGLAFSGGVDSFHALWRHLPANEPLPSARVTHCLMVNGFDDDSDVGGEGPFRALEALYGPMMERLGVELIVVRTNLLAFLGPTVRSQSFSAFLTASALLLGGLLSRLYIGSGLKLTTQGLTPDGSHAMLDHWLATETVETLTVDAHVSRVEKTLALAEWPETYDLLRVCWERTGVQPGKAAIANCCACEKCLRTMMILDAAGVLERFGCFAQPLLRRRVRDIDYRWALSRLFTGEIIEFASRRGRHDIARDVRSAMFNSIHFRPTVRRLVRASYRLEQHSTAYRALVTPPKSALRRLGVGAGWLY